MLISGLSFRRHPDGRWSCESAGKLSKLLLQNVKHLKPIEESYQKVGACHSNLKITLYHATSNLIGLF